MVVVHIQHFLNHFLNNKGIQYFPTWIKEISEIFKSYIGFISLQHLKAINNNKGCHLLLEFENLNLLKVWDKSRDHQEFIDTKLSFYKFKNKTPSFMKVTQNTQ